MSSLCSYEINDLLIANDKQIKQAKLRLKQLEIERNNLSEALNKAQAKEQAERIANGTE